ncbi:MAG: hypothetical protein KGH75_12920 [Rhodospirillales bacterium]|nr:hypothetical protein [Rhodospirillales bacterium]
MSNLEKDLAEVVRLRNAARANPSDKYSIEGSEESVEYIRELIYLFATHHAEIAHNARRIKALEQAMKEVTEDGFPKYSGPAIIWIRQRADEIMHEGTPEKAE